MTGLPAIGDMAYKLRVKEGEAAKRVQALKDAGLLDEDETGVSPHNWDARQFKSDVSTDRVKRFRQRCGNEKRNVSVTASETETESDSSLRSQSASELRSQAERFYRSYRSTSTLERPKRNSRRSFAPAPIPSRSSQRPNATPPRIALPEPTSNSSRPRPSGSTRAAISARTCRKPRATAPQRLSVRVSPR